MIEAIAAECAIHQEAVGFFAPNYKLMLPSYKRILRMVQPVKEHSSRTDALIELKGGGSIEFWTLNDEDAGRSRAYKRVIVDEASLVATGLRDIWEQAIEPTLLDYGGTAIMAGTPKGIDPDNFFYLACTDKSLGWTEFHAPTKLNPLLNLERVEALVNEYPALVYQQEFLAEFVDWSGAAFFSRDSLLIDGKPVDYPTHCDSVFATIDSATKTGRDHDGTGVIYWALQRFPWSGAYRLCILDWDYVQIEGSLLDRWLPTVFDNLEQFSIQTKARMGSIGALIEDKSSGMILLQQAARNDWPATAIDSKLTSVGKDERAISVSGYIFRGAVKISSVAFDKVLNFKGNTRNHLLSQVTGFRIGDKDAAKREDDLLDCFAYGTAIALGNAEGF